MISKSRKTGNTGENIAYSFLIEKGFRIIQTNYQEKWGEIDIIARDRDMTLVFIEVKALKGPINLMDGLSPEDNLNSSKLKKLRRTASLFVGKHPELIRDEKGWRIDLLAVVINPDHSGVKPIIRHYENI